MRISLIVILLLFVGCSSFERAYENSLTDAEKQKLDTVAYLVRSFRIDYEKGRRSVDSRMRVTRERNRYFFTPVDSVIIYTSDGLMIEKDYYDPLGQLTHMLLYTGTQPNQLITDLEAGTDTLNGQAVRYEIVRNGFYANGKPQTVERWVRIGNKAKKHGKWEYFTEDGAVSQVITYELGKRVD